MQKKHWDFSFVKQESCAIFSTNFKDPNNLPLQMLLRFYNYKTRSMLIREHGDYIEGFHNYEFPKKVDDVLHRGTNI